MQKLLSLICCAVVGMLGCSVAPVKHEPQAEPGHGEAVVMEPYPLIGLRSDLGEFLVKHEKKSVQTARDSVARLVHARTRKHLIGRGDHSTPHGCYPAQFTVLPTLAPELSAGIAAPQNQGATFAAIVRYSNSEPPENTDLRSASRGLALKVDMRSRTLDGQVVPHPYADIDFLLGHLKSGVYQQDFLAGSSKTFFMKDIAAYTTLFNLREVAETGDMPDASIIEKVQGGVAKLKVILFYRDVAEERKFGPAKRTNADAPLLLTNTFSGILPYAWDTKAVKFKFIPYVNESIGCHRFDPAQHQFDAEKEPRYQMRLISEVLQKNDLCYHMAVQVRPASVLGEVASSVEPAKSKLEKHFPIEDATVYWPDAQEMETVQTAQGEVQLSSAFQNVALFKIKQGTAPLSDHTCETLSFNPWTGLKAHQPLGSLSRSRLVVYEQSTRERRTLYPK
jgi:hypothetical protein